MNEWRVFKFSFCFQTSILKENEKKLSEALDELKKTKLKLSASNEEIVFLQSGNLEFELFIFELSYSGIKQGQVVPCFVFIPNENVDCFCFSFSLLQL